jgi:hypothetical protein
MTKIGTYRSVATAVCEELHEVVRGPRTDAFYADSFDINAKVGELGRVFAY